MAFESGDPRAESHGPMIEELPRTNILLAVTGSVATVKLPLLYRRLVEEEHFNVRIIATRCAMHFVTDDTIRRLVLTDEDEWKAWNAKGDPVLHIELRRWAHILVIAPLDANTLAKLANGISDNLVTCVVRAWDIGAISRFPVLICPAMNTMMYQNPFTGRHLRTLKQDLGFKVIQPVSKVLACGDEGIGGMAEIDDIVEHICREARSPGPLPPNQDGKKQADKIRNKE